MISFQIAGITRMEPAVFVDSRSGGFRFLIIAGSNSLTAKQDFIVFSNLHFKVGHDSTYRTYLIPLVEEAGYGSRRFRQSITHHHIDTHRVHEFANFIGYGSAGSREEITVLNTDCLFQQGVDSLFIEFILQMKHQGRRFACTQIINVVHLPDFKSIQHHCFPQAALLGNLLLYTGIYLLPKAGNAAHQCRTYLLDSGLNICRTKIDANLHTSVKTEISPCFFKHMRQRKEVHGHILIRHGSQADIVDADSLSVVEVVQHHSFRLAGGAGCIKNIGKVAVRCTGGTLFHNGIVR